MGLSKLGSGEKISGASAISLFVLMFFDWFGTKSSDSSFGLFSVGHSAWEALDFTLIVLGVAIVAALGVVALRIFASAYESPFLANAVVAILGIVSAGLIIFRIIDPPNFGSIPEPFFRPVKIEGTAQSPIFLALAAAVGIAFGGLLGVRDGGGASRGLGAGRRRGSERLVPEGEIE